MLRSAAQRYARMLLAPRAYDAIQRRADAAMFFAATITPIPLTPQPMPASHTPLMLPPMPPLSLRHCCCQILRLLIHAAMLPQY